MKSSPQAKFILGIDTTFHTSALSLIDKNGRVFFNKKISTDFEIEDAQKFFNFHTRNILRLVKPIIDKYGKDIFLVSASSKEGAFHSLPVGAIVANTISYLLNKKIIGVDHEIAHLYGNWLDRDRKKFAYPVLSLNISGAHSNIYLIQRNHKIKKIKEIVWLRNKKSYNGLGALFDAIRIWLSLAAKKGQGGYILEKLARSGQTRYRRQLNGLIIKAEGDNLIFANIEHYIRKKIEEFKTGSAQNDFFYDFQKDFASSLLDKIFDLLIVSLGDIAKKIEAKEIHLSGGAAMNKILKEKAENFCKTGDFQFKSPSKSEYCGDNGAMTAMAGYYQGRYSGQENKKFLTIAPSDWHYGYYFKNFVK